jgi:hypothetical protein
MLGEIHMHMPHSLKPQNQMEIKLDYHHRVHISILSPHISGKKGNKKQLDKKVYTVGI